MINHEIGCPRLQIWDGGDDVPCTCLSICPYCKNEVDLDVCYCGTMREDHNFVEHSFVPLGCDCGRELGDNL